MIDSTDSLLALLIESGAQPEADRLLKAVTHAVDLALVGRTADGYELLVHERHAQKQLIGESAPWAAQLMDGWKDALDRYAREFKLGRA